MSKYKLNKMKFDSDIFKVVIVADSNDGDYITNIEWFDAREFNGFVIDELIRLIRDCSKGHELGNYEEDFEYITIPYNGWDGWCHSLEEVSVTYFDIDGQAYEVEINMMEKVED